MRLKKLTLATLLCALPQLSISAPSINEMQSCQALLDFVDSKLESAPAKYDAQQVAKVRKGLQGYNQFIQTTIVTPGLLKFNQGDKTKADLMQTQVDAYKKNLVTNFQKRYPQNRLFTDQAIDVNNCAKKAVPSGQALEDLKKSLNIMIKLAQLN